MPQSGQSEVRFSFQSIREIDKITRTIEERLLTACSNRVRDKCGSTTVEPVDVAHVWNQLLPKLMNDDEQQRAA
jgi:hypothetical protein